MNELFCIGNRQHVPYLGNVSKMDECCFCLNQLLSNIIPRLLTEEEVTVHPSC